MRLLLGLITLLFLPILIAVALLLQTESDRSRAAPLAGAIFTTTPDGGIVNENVRYKHKIEVYLDGGPGPNAPQTAAGLPDGDYVFQVTGPSGKVLLSEDPSKCRIVRVLDGVIVELVLPSTLGLGLTDDYEVANGKKNAQTVPCHIQDPPNPPDPAGPGDAGTSGHHDTNTDSDHGPPAIVVQLMPFFDTPNLGGVYKAWVIPLSRYDGDLDEPPTPVCTRKGRLSNTCNGNAAQIGFWPDPGFGPPRDQVKTDNFKVKKARFVSPVITVRKFHDVNGDCQFNDGEPEIGVDQFIDGDGNIVETDGGGWPFDVLDPNDIPDEGYTPDTIVAAVAGDWRITEGDFAHWQQTAAFLDSVGGCSENPEVVVPVAFTSGETHEVMFGNTQPAEILGRKFEDMDADGGPRESGDPGLPDWEIHLVGTDNQGNAVDLTAYTCGGQEQSSCMGHPDGTFWFSDIMPGSYVLSEVLEDGWLQSFPEEEHYDLTIVSGDALSELDFGNFRPVDIQAHKFFDRDENGQPDDGEGDLAGWQFCLTDEGDDPVTQDAFGDGLPDIDGDGCGVTGDDGLVSWLGIMPGCYTVTETTQDGWFATTPTSQRVCVEESGGDVTVEFGNVAPCNGLTPGYWKNWRNHYDDDEFASLLDGTIADVGDDEANIAEADAIFDQWDASPGDEISILKAMTLANQLTLNLTQDPELPNPSDGSIFQSCEVPEVSEDLGEILIVALDFIARLEDQDSGNDPSRDEILEIVSILDAFANLRTG